MARTSGVRARRRSTGAHARLQFPDADAGVVEAAGVAPDRVVRDLHVGEQTRLLEAVALRERGEVGSGQRRDRRDHARRARAGEDELELLEAVLAAGADAARVGRQLLPDRARPLRRVRHEQVGVHVARGSRTTPGAESRGRGRRAGGRSRACPRSPPGRCPRRSRARRRGAAARRVTAPAPQPASITSSPSTRGSAATSACVNGEGVCTPGDTRIASGSPSSQMTASIGSVRLPPAWVLMQRPHRGRVPAPVREGSGVDAVADFLTHLALERGASRHTVAAYRGDLAQLREFLRAARRRDRRRVRGRSRGLRRRARARRAVARHAPPAPGGGALAAAPPRPHRRAARWTPARSCRCRACRKRLPRVLSAEQCALLVEHPDATPLGLRDRAALELLYGGGLRVSELTGLRPGDLDLERGIVRVEGKGGRQRIVPTGRLAAEAGSPLPLARTAVPRQAARRRPRSCSTRAAAASRGRACSASCAATRPRWASSRPSRRTSCATPSRRTCSSSGADLRVVQELLGHASVATTEIYTHLGDGALRKAFERAHPRARADRGDRLPGVSRRAFIVVLDAVGAGELPDAAACGDEGSNTLAHVAEAVGGLRPAATCRRSASATCCRSRAARRSPRRPRWPAACSSARRARTRRSATGSSPAWSPSARSRRIPTGFPQDVLDAFAAATGRGVIGNVAASGTEIIERLGEEHQRTGKWIVYTSADSVFQIAAHEATVPLEELYAACRTARGAAHGRARRRPRDRPAVRGRARRLPPHGEPPRLLARAAAAELPLAHPRGRGGA